MKELCDQTLYDIIQLLEVQTVIAVGRYAEGRAKHVLRCSNPLNTRVCFLTHPSPRVANNQDWVVKAESRLAELGIVTRYLT